MAERWPDCSDGKHGDELRHPQAVLENIHSTFDVGRSMFISFFFD